MNPRLEACLRMDRSIVLDLVGLDPEPWQRSVLNADEDILLLCHRQAGKSTIVAALAIATAILDPEKLIIVSSASQRQSSEIYAKVQRFHRALGQPHGVESETAVSLTLGNGSRVVSLPDSPDTIVGYSGPSLVILDEAARVSDDTYIAVRPMLARSKGRLVCMSTPRGKMGWFYEAWTNPDSEWKRFMLRASENPWFERNNPGFLLRERASMPLRGYLQEYECSFEDTEDNVFSSEHINSAYDTSEEGFFVMGGAA